MKRNRKIFCILIICCVFLSTIHVRAINQDELVTEETKNYFPPYIVLDLTVNVSTTSGSFLQVCDLDTSRSSVVMDIHLRASKDLAVLSPHGLNRSFEVTCFYPAAEQDEEAEIAYQDRDIKSTTAMDLLDEENLVISTEELTKQVEYFGVNEDEPDDLSVHFGSTASESEQLSYHIFTATRDINNTAYGWVVEALGLENESLVYEMNATRSDLEYKVPYTYSQDSFLDGVGADAFALRKLTLRKQLAGAAGKAYDTGNSMKKSLSNTGRNKKNFFFKLGSKFIDGGKKFLPFKSLKTITGVVNPKNTVVLVVVGIVAITILGIVVFFVYKRRQASRRGSGGMFS